EPLELFRARPQACEGIAVKAADAEVQGPLAIGANADQVLSLAAEPMFRTEQRDQLDPRRLSQEVHCMAEMTVQRRGLAHVADARPAQRVPAPGGENVQSSLHALPAEPSPWGFREIREVSLHSLQVLTASFH